MAHYPRIHGFEIIDQPWCPVTMRDGITEYLQFSLEVIRPYAALAPRLMEAARMSGATRFVDLGSGAGGPWRSLLAEVSERGIDPLPVLLTDLHPNRAAIERSLAASESGVTYHREPVNLLDVPESLTGFRTLFSAYHHFTPTEATAILRDAVEKGQGIGILEATSRALLAPFFMLPAPLVVLLTTPLIRPFSWTRLFWTYVMPAVPFIGLYDGMVSCFRTYTPEEMLAFAAEADPGGTFTWESDEIRVPRLITPVAYLIGTPKG